MGSEALRVIPYRRVSSDEQATRGVSLEAQEERLDAYCRTEGLRVVCGLCDPGRTGGDMDRPGLKRALELLDGGEADGLVVVKLDRLTRCLRDWELLCDRYFLPGRGKRLCVVMDPVDLESATGRMLARIRIAVGQHELETTIERTADAMLHKRSKGERLGTIPYGQELDPFGARSADGRLIGLRDNHLELGTLSIMKARRAAGDSYRSIAATLNAGGFPTRSGRPWAASTVQQILARANRVPTSEAAPELLPDRAG